MALEILVTGIPPTVARIALSDVTTVTSLPCLRHSPTSFSITVSAVTPVGEKYDADARTPELGALGTHVARGIEDDDGLVASLGKRGNVTHEQLPGPVERVVVELAGVWLVHERLVARRAEYDVVAVHDEQLVV